MITKETFADILHVQRDLARFEVANRGSDLIPFVKLVKRLADVLEDIAGSIEGEE